MSSVILFFSCVSQAQALKLQAESFLPGINNGQKGNVEWIQKPRLSVLKEQAISFEVSHTSKHTAEKYKLVKEKHSSQAQTKHILSLQTQSDGSMQQLDDDSQNTKQDDVNLSTLDESGRLLQQFCFDFIVYGSVRSGLFMANV